MKLIVATLSLAQKESADLSRQLLRCMAELMVLFARSGNHQASQGLRELSRKLMTLLAGGEFAAEFKSTLLSLPPQARQALQVMPAGHVFTFSSRLFDLPKQRRAQFGWSWYSQCDDQHIKFVGPIIGHK